jgi:glycosyltransferase involved in cell wall biosynthesis
MADAGYDITIWTLLSDTTLARGLSEEVTVESMGLSNKIQLWKLVPFVQQLRRDRPDVLHTFYFHDSMIARCLKLLMPDLTVVCEVLSVRDDQPWYRRTMENAGLDVPDNYISNSEAGREHMIGRGVDPDDIRVIYNARDVEEYSSPADSSYLYDEFGLDESSWILGNVSRLIETKGHEDLIRTVSLLRSRGVDAHALIVGDGPMYDTLQSFAAAEGVSEHVTFTGTRDDIPELLDVMDVFVFPTYKEGLPGALIEAMLARVPIVSTPVDGCSELIDDESGILVPVNEPERIVQAVERLVENPEFASTLATRAYHDAVERFSADGRMERYIEFYDGVVSSAEEGYQQ